MLNKYHVPFEGGRVSWDDYDDLIDRLSNEKVSKMKVHMIDSRYENTSYGVSSYLLNEALSKIDSAKSRS